MNVDLKDTKTENQTGYISAYNSNVLKIIIFACFIIIASVIATGVINYSTAQNAVIEKSKSIDMVYILKSMSAKIEGRVDRAKETSYILARDPANISWLEGEEKDSKLGAMVLDRLHDIAFAYDYSTVFLTSAKTLHYYFKQSSDMPESNAKIYTLSSANPADAWFFDTISSKQPVSLNVNFDRGMNDTYLFVNALMGGIESPLGITGVGMSLKDISEEFQEYKLGKHSRLWLIDAQGEIQLSDNLSHRGENIESFIPAFVLDKMKKQLKQGNADPIINEYTDTTGEVIDISYQKLGSSEWVLVFQIPRKENIAAISSIRINTIMTILFILIFVIIIFYLVSKKIANPYKQVLLINKDLEEKVNLRTQELREANLQVMDSIGYAKRMQEAILPSDEDLKKAFKEYFVIWKPRDVVGGDFYWLRNFDDVTVAAVGDCTGHGVPGALMTMTVNALLYHIVTNVSNDNPTVILQELDRMLKQALNKESGEFPVDDGLDIGICCIKKNRSMLFAGAKIGLYVKGTQELTFYKGYNRAVGYKISSFCEDVTNVEIAVNDGDTFYMVSDGFAHQNGGEKDFPFGTKRLFDLIDSTSTLSLEDTKLAFEDALAHYMQGEPQRDDIVLLAFKNG